MKLKFLFETTDDLLRPQLYHVAPRKFLSSIKEYGLRPKLGANTKTRNKNEFIYLAINLEAANVIHNILVEFGDSFETDYILIKVLATPEDLERDPDFEYGVRTRSNILPDKLEIHDNYEFPTYDPYNPNCKLCDNKGCSNCKIPE